MNRTQCVVSAIFFLAAAIVLIGLAIHLADQDKTDQGLVFAVCGFACGILFNTFAQKGEGK